MNLDTELERWRGEWQSEAAVPADLRRRVERQSRWLQVGLAADILVTIVIGGGVSVLAVRSPQPDMLVLTAATWLFIAVAWALALAVYRGLWTPAGMDTATFVDLSIRRCRARLASVAFGAGLAAVEFAFCLGWDYVHTSPRMPLAQWFFFSSIPIDLAWGFALAIFAFVWWYRRRKLAELEWWLALRMAAWEAAAGHGPAPL
jgi:hypothetical protein